MTYSLYTRLEYIFMFGHNCGNKPSAPDTCREPLRWSQNSPKRGVEPLLTLLEQGRKVQLGIQFIKRTYVETRSSFRTHAAIVVATKKKGLRKQSGYVAITVRKPYRAIVTSFENASDFHLAFVSRMRPDIGFVAFSREQERTLINTTHYGFI